MATQYPPTVAASTNQDVDNKPQSPAQSKPRNMIDSHIHLWPGSASNSTSHTWMTPQSMPLAREHLLHSYVAAASQIVSMPSSQHLEIHAEASHVKTTESRSTASSVIPASEEHIREQQTQPHLLGVVYVETDRALLDTKSEHPEERYTHPLQEIVFLRNLITSSPHSLVLAIIPWAPIDEGPTGLLHYLALAKQTAGDETWSKVVGFRYLVQGMREQGVFEAKVRSQAWMDGLRWLAKEGSKWRTQRQEAEKKKKRGFVFEVGVDQRQGGTWQLDEFAECIERLRRMEDEDGVDDEGERTSFVLSKSMVLFHQSFFTSVYVRCQKYQRPNQLTLVYADHFMKPSLTSPSSFAGWQAALIRLSKVPPTYLKLSGFLTELNVSPLTSTSAFNQLVPYVKAAFDTFGARRIMFGSDWPVCNVGVRSKSGSEAGEEVYNGAWSEWHEIVESLLNEVGVGEEEREWVWWRTAREAYGLDVVQQV